MKSLKVIIAGGSGMIGKHLKLQLEIAGYEVKTLGRNSQSDYLWDINKKQINPQIFNDCYAVINLTGVNVAQRRWTSSFKKQIYSSRIESTKLIFETIQSSNINLPVFITASAIGIYKNGFEIQTEHSISGSDFLAKTCSDWEKEAMNFSLINTRVACMRIGIVLARTGGFLPKISKLIKYYLGAILGNGNQMISWVHVKDVCNAFIYVLKNEECSGAYNVTAPHPVSNKNITQIIAKKLKRKLILPAVPEFILKIILGEFATEVLSNKNVIPEKLLESNFIFEFNEIGNALDDLLEY